MSSSVLRSEGAKSHAVLSGVPDVDIDPSGRFKYILIELKLDKDFKYIVRGYERCGYHADIFDEINPSLRTLGVKAKCRGGGRILHNQGELSVYGYSQGYGRADHSIAVALLKEHYPTYKSITWSNDGY